MLLLMMGVTCINAQTNTKTSKQEEYKQEVREKLQLDYSMPDYSTSTIDSKVMGPRLANILVTLCNNYQQYMNLSALSVI